MRGKYIKYKSKKFDVDKFLFHWMREISGNKGKHTIPCTTEHVEKIQEGRRKHYAFFIPKKKERSISHRWYGNVTYSYDMPKTEPDQTQTNISLGIKLLNIVPTYSRHGKNNHNWKDGVSKLNHLIRTSDRFKEWRTSVFERDGYTCKITGVRGDLHAHHITPLSVLIKDNNIKTIQEAVLCDELFDISNGVTLTEFIHKSRFKELHCKVFERGLNQGGIA